MKLLSLSLLALLLPITSIATPANAQPGYGFGPGSSSPREETPDMLPGPNDAWRGASFTSYNGECPPMTRREVLIAKEGKYVPGKNFPIWVTRKWKITECTNLHFGYSFIPSSGNTCWEGTSYAGNGYCRANKNVAFPIQPKNGHCPRGTKPDIAAGVNYCAVVLGYEGNHDQTLSVDIVKHAKF